MDTDCSLGNLAPKLLIWTMRRNLRPEPVPHRRVVVDFRYADRPADDQRFWLIVAP